MKVSPIYVLVLAQALILNSCSKEKDQCCDPNIESFYTVQRNVLLVDSFIDNRKDWVLYRSDTSGTGTFYGSQIFIDSGLYLKSNQGDYGYVEASKSIDAGELKYLAAEVKFENYKINLPSGVYAVYNNNAQIQLSNGNSSMLFPYLKTEYDDGYIDLSNEILHVLLDFESNRGYAYSQHEIKYVKKGSGNHFPVSGNDLSKLVLMNEWSGSEGEIKFQAHGYFVDMFGYFFTEMDVEYVIVYEPVFP